MNGEVSQASQIVIAARRALSEQRPVSYEPDRYVNSISFVFLRKGGLFGKSLKCDCVEKWFEECVRNGLDNIQFHIPPEPQNRFLLGFSNTSSCSLVCYWKDGSVSCFIPKWAFDNDNRCWNVTYTEAVSGLKISDMPVYENNAEDFRRVLKEIEELAGKINEKMFAGIFATAEKAFGGEYDGNYEKAVKDLPDEFKGMYVAASRADVFGAMGSWNDSPPYEAAEKGLSDDYDRLSSQLLTQIRYALLYSVNESWK